MTCSGETYPNCIVTTRSPCGSSGWRRRRGSGGSSQRRLRAAGVVHPAGHEGVDVGADLVVGEPAVAVRGDGRDDREDPAGEVGTAGGGVLVGRVVEGLDGAERGVLDRELLMPELLQGAPGEEGAGADGVELVLLVAAAGHVVGEQPAGLRRV